MAWEKAREILRNLLLLPSYLQLESWQINPSLHQIRLTIASMEASANCPICQRPAIRVHSYYERTLAALPWNQYKVSWQLQVRKFFCSNIACPRRIFTERLDSWLTRAVQSELGALVGFALRLGQDYKAVKAGVTLEWSNGQTEGQKKYSVKGF